jgi:Ca2+-binding RTX toxin-like protein
VGRGRAVVGLLALVALTVVVDRAAGAEEAGATCAGEPVTISWDDPGVGLTINGTNRRDVIQGGPQNEVINGHGGADFICGGEGNDRIDGGTGRDELLGQGDSDTFVGADLGGTSSTVAPAAMSPATCSSPSASPST